MSIEINDQPHVHAELIIKWVRNPSGVKVWRWNDFDIKWVLDTVFVWDVNMIYAISDEVPHLPIPSCKYPTGTIEFPVPVSNYEEINGKDALYLVELSGVHEIFSTNTNIPKYIKLGQLQTSRPKAKIQHDAFMEFLENESKKWSKFAYYK